MGLEAPHIPSICQTSFPTAPTQDTRIRPDRIFDDLKCLFSELLFAQETLAALLALSSLFQQLGALVFRVQSALSKKPRQGLGPLMAQAES